MNRAAWDHMVRRGTMLEIGASLGNFINDAKFNEWDVVGVEPSKVAVKHCKDKYGIEMFCGTFEDYILANEHREFDCVSAFDVVEHSTNPSNFLESMLAWTRPGGMIVMDTPNPESVEAQFFKSEWNMCFDEHFCLIPYSTLSKFFIDRRHKILTVSSDINVIGEPGGQFIIVEKSK